MTATEIDPTEVTPERALMLAQHAIHVQGGFSTPEIEAERARKDMAASAAPIDWDKMQAELDTALAAKVAALPTTPGSAQQTDVTAVLANIDQGEALRDRIKDLQKELKIHEDAVKDVLGEATEGVDATGHVVVRFPHRARHDLDKAKVKDILSDEDFAACSKVTNYRVILYGEG